MNTKIIYGIIGLLLIAGVGYYFMQQSSAPDLSMQNGDAMMEDESMSDDASMSDSMEDGDFAVIEYDYFTQLDDVTTGPVDGVDTNSQATGTAQAVFADGAYMVHAEFENLPAAPEGFFYEGWVVNKAAGPSVISTGPVEKIASVYMNDFTSDEDLTDHTFYVLTLEPDDNDPAPAAHILEGTMEMVQ